MVSFPFLIPYHYPPIPSFYSEWWAALLGLSAAAVIFTSREVWKGFAIPSITAIPALFIAMMLFQWAVGIIMFPQAVLVHTLYLLWAALMSCVGATMVRKIGLPLIAGSLAGFILAGALASSLILFLQFQGVSTPYSLVFQGSYGGRPSANLGQANQMANYLWLGIASALYLQAQGKCRPSLGMLAVLILVLAAALTSSRGSVLHSIALAALATVWWYRERSGPSTRMALVALALLPLLIGLSLLIKNFQVGSSHPATVVDRFAPAVVASDLRIPLWRQAWRMFEDHPWQGNGVGNYRWRSFELASQVEHSELPFPAEHAHNILLQWLADFGGPITFAGLLMLLLWTKGFFRRRWNQTDWWGISLLAVIANHSMLEYPLWYAFFLGLAALLLGAMDSHVRVISYPRGHQLSWIVLAMAAFNLVTLRQDNLRLEAAAHWTLTGKSATVAWAEARTHLVGVIKNSLLGPYGGFGILLGMELQKENAAAQVILCKGYMTFHPDHEVIVKCAAAMALEGGTYEPLRLLRETAAAFPDSVGLMKARLAEHVARYPELSPLLAFAIQK